MQETILIIDDSREILFTISEICKFQGWIPKCAANFNQAAKMLKNSSVDLVLLDYHMPGINGLEAVILIRRMNVQIPVIVLTCDENPTVMKKTIAAGADDYALKPVKMLDLVSRINVHLKYSKAHKDAAGVDKGISQVTLTCITNALEANAGFLDIDEICSDTGVKKKTVYRYLNYLTKNNQVEIQCDYGCKGRPKMLYRIKPVVF